MMSCKTKRGKEMRKKYWNQVKECLLNGDAKKATNMIMAVITCDVEAAKNLYMGV